MIKEVGQETYDQQITILKKLVKQKEERSGIVEDIKDLVDQRDESEKGKMQLHSGYDTMCGVRGNKLSGG